MASSIPLADIERPPQSAVRAAAVNPAAPDTVHYSASQNPLLTRSAPSSNQAPQCHASTPAGATPPLRAPNSSFRDNYGQHGVGGYYEKFGAAYTNPHEREIRLSLRKALSTWPEVSLERVLDLACGSGEATAGAHGFSCRRNVLDCL